MESNRENKPALVTIDSFNKILSSVNKLKEAAKNLDELNKNIMLNILHSIIEPIFDIFPEGAPRNPLEVLHTRGQDLPLLKNRLPNQINPAQIERTLGIITSVMKRVPKFISQQATQSFADTFAEINTALRTAIAAADALQSPSSYTEEKDEPMQSTQSSKSDSTIMEEKGSPSTTPPKLMTPEEEAAVSPISILPDESLLRIMSFLTPKENLKVSQVAHRYHKISADSTLWRQYLEQDFNDKVTSFDELTQKYGSLKAAWLAFTVEAGAQSYLVLKHPKAKDPEHFDPVSLTHMSDRDFFYGNNDVIGIYATREQAIEAAQKHSTKNADCYVCAASEKVPVGLSIGMNNIYRTDYILSIALYDRDKKDLLPPAIVKLPPDVKPSNVNPKDEKNTPRKMK